MTIPGWLLSRRVNAAALCTLTLLVGSHPLIMAGHAQAPQSAASRRGPVFTDQPPVPGALRGEQAVAALRGEVGRRIRERGPADVEKIVETLASDRSLWLTLDGDLIFADPALGDPVEAAASEPGPAPTPDGYTASGVPVHHSLAGAPYTLYLDFDGEVGFNNSAYLDVYDRTLPAFTLDADPTTFTADEQTVMSRTWGRVAEDWAPFGIDVTTERPATLGPNALWVIVTTASSVGMPSYVGGVAPFTPGGWFGSVPALHYPSFTFYDTTGPTYDHLLADTSTQEAGHMFGLLHDGTNIWSAPDENGNTRVVHTEYYAGHGEGPTSWAPVMGAGGKNVTQFSNGDYPNASNHEDDVAIIGARLGRRSFGAGHLNSANDVHDYYLPSSGVYLAADVTPFRAGANTDGGNLDVALEIVDANGVVIAASDDPEQTAATLTTDVPEGTHYLRIRPSFAPGTYSAYGSMGKYTLNGSFRNVAPSFSAPAVVTVAFSSGPYAAVWATSLSAGPAHEAYQALSFEISEVSNTSLFSVPPSIAPDGTLSFTPAPGAAGTATLSAVLRDDGGTEIGGDDSSDPVTLTIEVRHGFQGFSSPKSGQQVTAGKRLDAAFSLAGAAAVVTRVQLWALQAGPGPMLRVKGELPQAACTYSNQAGSYQCALTLPKTLQSGTTYWLVAQYLNSRGDWISPAPVTGASTSNPVPIVVK